VLEESSNIHPCVRRKSWKHGLNKDALRPTACSQSARPCTSAIVQWPVGWIGQTKLAHRLCFTLCVWVGLGSTPTSRRWCPPFEARRSGCHARYPRRRWSSMRRTSTTWWGRGRNASLRPPVRHVMHGDTTKARNTDPPSQSYTPGRSICQNRSPMCHAKSCRAPAEMQLRADERVG
jgi:hypothetical protein